MIILFTSYYKKEDKINEDYKHKEPNPYVPKPEVENPDTNRESQNKK